MKRSVGDLANFSDDRLFKEVSEGIPLIVENAVSLDETAHRLYRDKEFRASEIIAKRGSQKKKRQGGRWELLVEPSPSTVSAGLDFPEFHLRKEGK